MPLARWLALVLLVILLVPAAAHASTSYFIVKCGYSHSAFDDPILDPGGEGSFWHQHDFYGNTTTDANSTYSSLIGQSSTCAAASDTAAYWMPTPFSSGVATHGAYARIYYSNDAYPKKVTHIPAGLQLVGGDSRATSSLATSRVHYDCGQNTPISTQPYDCTRYVGGDASRDGLVEVVFFPRCWDGRGLAPADTAYAPCSSAFPDLLPKISMRVHTQLVGATPQNFAVSSGAYYTLHADFWNSWNQDRLNYLVDNCLNKPDLSVCRRFIT